VCIAGQPAERGEGRRRRARSSPQHGPCVRAQEAKDDSSASSSSESDDDDDEFFCGAPDELATHGGARSGADAAAAAERRRGGALAFGKDPAADDAFFKEFMRRSSAKEKFAAVIVVPPARDAFGDVLLGVSDVDAAADAMAELSVKVPVFMPKLKKTKMRDLAINDLLVRWSDIQTGRPRLLLGSEEVSRGQHAPLGAASMLALHADLGGRPWEHFTFVCSEVDDCAVRLLSLMVGGRCAPPQPPSLERGGADEQPEQPEQQTIHEQKQQQQQQTASASASAVPLDAQQLAIAAVLKKHGADAYERPLTLDFVFEHLGPAIAELFDAPSPVVRQLTELESAVNRAAAAGFPLDPVPADKSQMNQMYIASKMDAATRDAVRRAALLVIGGGASDAAAAGASDAAASSARVTWSKARKAWKFDKKKGVSRKFV